MEELIELALKRIEALEKKLEKYFSILNVGNEMDFILKGTYVLQSDIENVMAGKLEGEEENG